MKKLMVILVVVSMAAATYANSAPVVSGVSASQRGDDSKLVDIYYNLADADGDSCTIWVAVSDDGGQSWSVPAMRFSGDTGGGIIPGTNKHIIWDAGGDLIGISGTFKVRIFASDGYVQEDIVLVPGGWFLYDGNSWRDVGGFYIDKYEVTNEQYAHFLNEADPSSQYYTTSNLDIARGGESGNYYYVVIPGRDNYPVRYVNFYDAEAYAAWMSSLTGLSYRLPTEQEWQKAAGWNPDTQYLWTYGYQSNSASCSYMNYNNCVGGLRPVGYYDGVNPSTNDAKSYYGCYDMSGNVWEWTSSIYSGSSRVLRGGYWNYNATYCSVTYRYSGTPSSRYNSVGFRLVLNLN